MVLAAAFCMFTLNLAVTLATFARTVHAGPAGYAMLTSSLAVGSMVGALIAAGRTRSTVRGLTWIGCVLSGLYLVAAAMPTLWSLGCVLAAIGIISIQLFTAANASVQLAAGRALRGRVMGVYLLVETGSAAVGGPVLGVINEYLGPRIGLILTGAMPAALIVLLSVLLFVRRRIYGRDSAAQISEPQPIPPVVRTADLAQSAHSRLRGLGLVLDENMVGRQVGRASAAPALVPERTRPRRSGPALAIVWTGCCSTTLRR
jgi:hypothetical protein